MTEKLNPGGLPATRKKYTPAFKAECVRQVAAGARQSDVACAQGISPALLGHWQRQALEAAVPSSAGEMPWARATSLCRAPAATWRTHSALKAGVYFLRVAGKPPKFSFSVMGSES